MSAGRVCMVLAALLYCSGLGGMALLDPDEGRYAATAREMIDSGDPILPRFNGEPRLNKPPLIYWAQAAAFLVMGEGEAAARLPSALAALALLGLVAWWAALRPGRADPVAAAAILAATPLYFACARLAITDMLLALGVGATLLIWHEAATAEDAASRRRLSIASALSCGVAVLAKGPVGAILPALVIGATAAVTRRRGMITARGSGVAAAGILLVAGPWTLGLAGRVGWEEILDLVRREGLERSAWGLDHPRPVYYLLLTFWPLFFPWSLVAPAAVWRAARGRDSGTVPVFLACWLVVVAVFFTGLADKNDAWLLPAAPPLAILASRWLPRRAALGGSAVTALLLAGAILYGSGPLSRERSMKDLVQAARLGPGGGRGTITLLSYRIHKPSLVWYSGRTVRWVRTGKELRQALAGIPGDHPVAVVLERSRLSRMKPGSLPGFREIGAAGDHVALLRESPPAPRSAAAPPPCSCCV